LRLVFVMLFCCIVSLGVSYAALRCAPAPPLSGCECDSACAAAFERSRLVMDAASSLRECDCALCGALALLEGEARSARAAAERALAAPPPAPASAAPPPAPASAAPPPIAPPPSVPPPALPPAMPPPPSPKIPFFDHATCLEELAREHASWRCPTTGEDWKKWNSNPETQALIAAAGGLTAAMREFMQIYERETWNCGSGGGSNLDFTARTVCNLAPMLPTLLNVDVVVDFPCGTFALAPPRRPTPARAINPPLLCRRGPAVGAAPAGPHATTR